MPQKERLAAKNELRLKRILFFDHTAALGGGEIALLHLIRNIDLSRYTPVVLLSADGPLVRRLGPDVELYVLPLSKQVVTAKKDNLGLRSFLALGQVVSLVRYVFRVARFLRSKDIRLLHTNSLKSDIIGGFAAVLARCPVIWHLRDRIDDDYLPSSVATFFRWLCRHVPTYIIANSAATVRTIQPDYKVDGPTRPGLSMSVIHDGIDPCVPSSPLRKEASSFRLGLIGRISPWKGQHVFIEAAAEVHKEFPGVKFFIVGGALFGENLYEQQLTILVSELELEDAVEFMGFRDDVQEIIANLDIVVHASTTGEPFGQVIIEGMAAGKPVIATNGGGVPEIVEDSITGLLVPMNDSSALASAICKLLRDPQRAYEMGQAGLTRVRSHFTISQTAQRVQDIYQQLLT